MVKTFRGNLDHSLSFSVLATLWSSSVFKNQKCNIWKLHMGFIVRNYQHFCPSKVMLYSQAQFLRDDWQFQLHDYHREDEKGLGKGSLVEKMKPAVKHSLRLQGPLWLCVPKSPFVFSYSNHLTPVSRLILLIWTAAWGCHALLWLLWLPKDSKTVSYIQSSLSIVQEYGCLWYWIFLSS